MGAYILRRILISIPVLLGITIIGFVALKLSPGDPLLTSVNPEVLANLMSHPELLEAERHRLGFDQPIFPNQYLTLARERPPGRPRLLDHVAPPDRRRDRRAAAADAAADGHRR